MKYITEYFDFLNEGYIQYSWKTHVDNIIEPLVDMRDYIYSESDDNVKAVNIILRKNKDGLIKVYHGTHPNHKIIEEGLKTTKMKTKRSLQSEVGYTYFSIYPSMAKTFAEMGYNITNAVVYEVLLPISEIKPDKDQLRNKRLYGGYDIGESLGESIVYGHGVRVKGDIPPYMIKIYEF